MNQLCDPGCLACCLWPYTIRRKEGCEYHVYYWQFTARVGEIQVPSNSYTIRLQLGHRKIAIRNLSQENGHQTVLDKSSDMALAPKKTLKGSLNTPHNGKGICISDFK